jgi:hypothetical protein
MADREVRQRDSSSTLARCTPSVIAAAGLVVAASLSPLVSDARADSHGGPGCEWGECGENPGDPDPDPGGPDDPGPSGPQPGDTRPDEYVTPACSGNGPPPGDGGALCGAAANSCQAEDEIRFFVYTRTERWNGSQWIPEGSWEFQGSECRGGDGTSDVTSQPGGPYPNIDVTHTYGSTGDYEVRVDVTYSGWYEFGGNRVDLPGTYTQPGEASTHR